MAWNGKAIALRGSMPGPQGSLLSVSITNVNVRCLREKVERELSHPTLILTVPGIGYRLAG